MQVLFYDLHSAHCASWYRTK